MPALRGGSKDDLQLHAQQIAHDEGREHLDIAAGVPDAEASGHRRAPETEEIVEADVRNIRRQSGAERRDLLTEGALHRNKLDDRRGDAGKPFLEIRRYDFDVSNIDDVGAAAICQGISPR
jgi:hypothetical protein